MAKRDALPSSPTTDSSSGFNPGSSSATGGKLSPPQNAFPSPPSEMESKHYYDGLPSRPILVARSGTTPWEAPTDPEDYSKLRQLGPAGNHPLSEVWNDELSLKVDTLLASMKVNWTSIDIVRIGIAEEHPPPVVLWIGVKPGSLSGSDGVIVVSKCKELLEEYNITDVDVEIRESMVWLQLGTSGTKPQ